MVITAAAAAVLFVVVLLFSKRLKAVSAERDTATQERDNLARRFKRVVDADDEARRILAGLVTVREQTAAEVAELANLGAKIESLRAEFVALDEESNLQSFGFYKPRYAFADSEKYELHLEMIREQQKIMLKDKTAAVCAIEWSVGGSRAEGKKATNQTLKLMLRAFNGECDAAIGKVRYNNIHVMEARINKSFEVINSCAQVNQCRILPEYLKLKLEELALVHEYEEKLQEEKEEQRLLREQIREEEAAQRQLEKAKADAEKEEERYVKALTRAREEIDNTVGEAHAKLQEEIAELQAKLDAVKEKERAISQAQLTKSGHVYVISNIGSFGEDVFKIGMTRRLEPLDRIKELGDASVPFQFDVHAVISTDNAPALECELHHAFEERRINRVNERKEFFRVSIDEIAAVVRRSRADIQITRLAAAEEYRKTHALLAAEQQLASTRLKIRGPEQSGVAVASSSESMPHPPQVQV